MKNRLPIILTLVWAWAVPLSLFAQSSYNIYFGDIHSQTWYSDGNKDQNGGSASTNATAYPLPVAKAITYARDVANNMDFLGVSDHNHNESLNMTLPFWRSGLHEADSVNQDGVFVGMYGQEWGTISGGGHVLIYGTDKLFGWNPGIYDVYVPKSNYTVLFDSVKKYNGFAYLAHPQSTDYTNLIGSAYNATWDSVIRGCAMKNGPALTAGYTESDAASGTYESYFHSMLKLGYHVAPIGNQDNHYTNFGMLNQQRTVVLAPSLTRANILDALRNRRAYASEDHNLQLRFEVGSHQMGEIFSQSGSIPIRVKVVDPDNSITSIVLRYGVPGSGSAPTTLTSVSSVDSLVISQPQTIGTTYYYYAYVTNSSGRHAWSAPMWITSVVGGPPASFNLTSPANASANQSTSGTLNWQSSSGATSYNIYLGTTNPPTTLVSSNASTSYSYAGLSTSTTYYWKVTAVNGTDSTVATGAPWNFTTVPSVPGTFTLSSPSNGATVQPTSGTLTWNSSSNVTQYDVYLDGNNPPTTIVSPNQAGTSYGYSGLANNTLKYWKVVAKNAGGSTTATSSPWNFTTVMAVPGAFTQISPSNGSVNQATSGTLTWNASANATQYDVYLDGNNPPTTVVSNNQSGTSYGYSGLSTSSTYYWKIVAKNNGGTVIATGAPWNFTTVPPSPGAFTQIFPSNGGTSQPTSGTLTWNASANATQYDVYLDGNNPPITIVSQNQAGTSYGYNGLGNNAVYYWKVVAKNAGGTTTASSSPWSFTTIVVAPSAFVQVSPSNGSVNQPTSGTLIWNTSTNATQYDVYLDGNNPPTTLVSTNQSGTTFGYSGLANSALFYWKVVAKNPAGNITATGAPWSFTTIAPSPAAFSLLSPQNGATGLSLSDTLQWEVSLHATSYDVYLDVMNPPSTKVSANQAGTSYVYNGLSNNTLYYWRVVAKNAVDSLSSAGTAWDFSTLAVNPPGNFAQLTPTNGSINQPLSGTLLWHASANATVYDIYLDSGATPSTMISSNQVDTSFQYSGLSNNTLYSWKVIAKNSLGNITATGSPWNFTTVPPAPGAFTLSSPSNSATIQPVSGTLTWNSSANATQYDVYLDGNNPPTTVVSTNQAGTSYGYSGLGNNVVYYWKVVAKNAGGNTPVTGSPWSFTTMMAVPGAFAQLLPSNGGINQLLSGTLSWQASSNATQYDVYLDGNNPPTTLVSSDQAGTSYGYSGLSLNSTYYWKIVAKNNGGTLVATGAPQSFSTFALPDVFSLIVPVDAATGQLLSGVLTWQRSPHATSYDIYLDSINPPAIVVDSNRTDTSYGFSGLHQNTTYYWKVIAKNPFGSIVAANAPLHFTTGDLPASVSNLTVGTVTQTSMQLHWVDNASNELGYRVYRSMMSNGSYTQTGGDLPGNTIAFQDTGLNINQRYFYQVVPFNGLGEGNAQALNSSTLAETPGQPTLQNFTFQSLQVILNPGNNPSWTQFTIKAVQESTVNYVQQNGLLGESPVWQTFADWGGASGMTIPNLRACRGYEFSVIAANDDGIETVEGVSANHVLPCFTVNQQVANDWNLLSVPVLVPDPRRLTVFPTSISRAFSYEGSYVQKDSLFAGIGYWLKFGNPESITFTGEPRLLDTIHLKTGWNIIGTMSLPLDVNSVIEEPSGIVSSNYFGYSGAYVLADSLRPMQGYWVKASSPGNIRVSASLSAQKGMSSRNIVSVPSKANSLTFEDHTGRRQTLYISDEHHEDAQNRFELPPVPPAESFDVRFQSQRFVETISSSDDVRDFPIAIQSVHDPVTLSWSVNEPNKNVSLLFDNHSVRMLDPMGSLRLPEHTQTIVLRIKSNSSSHPHTFALHQNFPNPFNPSTVIAYDLPVRSYVRLTVYNILGEVVSTLVDVIQSEGYHSTEWAPAQSSGIYYYSLEATNVQNPADIFRQVQQMNFVK